MTKRQQRSSRKRMLGRVRKRSTARVLRSGAVTHSGGGLQANAAKFIAKLMGSRGEG